MRLAVLDGIARDDDVEGALREEADQEVGERAPGHGHERVADPLGPQGGEQLQRARTQRHTLLDTAHDAVHEPVDDLDDGQLHR